MLVSEFSTAEQELLVALKLIALTRGRVTDQGLQDYRANPHTHSTCDWTAAVASLVGRGLLEHDGQVYALTDDGRAAAEAAHRRLLAESERAHAERKRIRTVDPSPLN